jgi:trafficking protein particle complex subunit 13
MENKEQFVSLKVMRLLKPNIHSAMTCFTEPSHSSDKYSRILLEPAFSSSIKSDESSFCLTDFLVIPQTFGNLYIGETFTSYICLHNHSSMKVKDLNIKVELRMTSQKIPLLFRSGISSVDHFENDQKFDGIVEHDVKELGTHM